MIELACPESCPYLIEARATATRRETELRMKETSEIDRRSLLLSDRALIALDRIERAIVNVQRAVDGPAFHDLADAEILSAVENTIKNIETEESGLIYEHRADTSRAGEVSRRIRSALEVAAEEVPSEARPRRSDTIRALNFARATIKAHIQRAGGEASRSYIRYIALFYPWPEKETRPLIV